MTNKMKNVPELRFPEFIEEWEEKRLGDVYKYQQGQQIPVENQYKIQINNMKRFIRIVDVTENPKKRYIKDRKESGLINQKDLIMIRYGASAGTISMGYEGVIANNLFKFVKKQNVDNRYFYFLLKKSHFKIKSLSSQSAMPALNFNAMDTLKFSIPQYSEQQKIGSFFSKLDRQIELEEQKLEKLEEQKKGYMQKIFSQQLRFKDENGNDYPEWKKKKLDDVANYRRGSFPQPYGNKEWYDEKNGEPFVQVVDVDKNMKLHNQTKQKISDLAKPKSVKGFKGDIVVTLQGSIGRVALLHYDAYIDRTLLLIDSFKIEMNKNYFKYVLYLLFLKEKERAPGGTIKTITKKVLSNFKIDIPNVGEQEKIGKFFEKYDKCIQKQSNKIELLKKRKKSFLQKMFV
ncbi:TPA: restriction endonuclease subunit S [Staphylococcus aureus]